MKCNLLIKLELCSDILFPDLVLIKRKNISFQRLPVLHSATLTLSPCNYLFNVSMPYHTCLNVSDATSKVKAKTQLSLFSIGALVTSVPRSNSKPEESRVHPGFILFSRMATSTSSLHILNWCVATNWKATATVHSTANWISVVGRVLPICMSCSKLVNFVKYLG